MSEDAHKTTEGAVLIKRIGRNVLNVGIFLVEVLFLILAGPALLKFFMPVVLGWGRQSGTTQAEKQTPMEIPPPW